MKERENNDGVQRGDLHAPVAHGALNADDLR